MSKRWQIRRGTTAENNAFTGAQGELTMDTEKKQIRIHDGVTQGGITFGDTVVEWQLPTSGNGYTWYRKYRSGWVEQGGVKSVNISTGTTITLPVVMSDTNYIAVITNNTYTSGTGQYASTCGITSSSQIKIQAPGATGTHTYSWLVSGIAA